MAAERSAGQQQSQEMMEGERPLRATGERRAGGWAGTASCRIRARTPASGHSHGSLTAAIRAGRGGGGSEPGSPGPEGGSGQEGPEPREQRGARRPREGGRTWKPRLREPSLKAPTLTGEGAGDCQLIGKQRFRAWGPAKSIVGSRGMDGKASALEANGLWQSDG